jgi:hypothetical protein
LDTIQLAAGNSINTGIYKFILSPTYGLISTYMDSFINTVIGYPYITCTYAQSVFNLTTNVGASRGSNFFNLLISMNNVSSTGTYNTKTGATDSEIKITGTANSVWSTLQGGNGILVISSVDTVLYRLSGTFSAIAVPDNINTSGNQTINGSFSNLYYP